MRKFPRFKLSQHLRSLRNVKVRDDSGSVDLSLLFSSSCGVLCIVGFSFDRKVLMEKKPEGEDSMAMLAMDKPVVRAA
jgi:hypothetical protein